MDRRRRTHEVASKSLHGVEDISPIGSSSHVQAQAIDAAVSLNRGGLGFFDGDANVGRG